MPGTGTAGCGGEKLPEGKPAGLVSGMQGQYPQVDWRITVFRRGLRAGCQNAVSRGGSGRRAYSEMPEEKQGIGFGRVHRVFDKMKQGPDRHRDVDFESLAADAAGLCFAGEPGRHPLN